MFTVTECLDILTFEKLLSTCTSANLAWRNPLRERQGWLRAWLAEYRRSVTQRRRLRTLAQSVFPVLESFRSRCGDITFITELLDEALNLLMPALHVEWVAAGFPEPQVVAGQWPPLGPPIMPGHVSVSTRPHDYSLYGTPRFLAFFERGFDDDGG